MTFSRVLEWIFRLVLAGMFVLAGYEKARDPIRFLMDIRSFQMVPDPWAAMLAMGLPWLELFCAAGILLKRLYLGSVAVISASLAVFIIAISWSWHLGRDFTCGCFGAADLGLTTASHLALNTTLLGMGIWLIWREFRMHARRNPA